MQKLTPEVVKQLNNLGGGFPPAPTGPNNEPQNDEQWILGDWLEEIRVRPGVDALVDLPVTDNEAGDVRFVIALGAWYWWDGAAWLPVAGGGGGVATVTASAPLSSSGGANPNISFSSWPANAPGALTNDGAGTLSWAPVGSGTSVDVPSVATEVLLAGEAVRFVSGGAQKADATNADARLQPVGFAVAGAGIGAPVDVRVAGLATVPAALFDVAPIGSDVGKRVWLSTTAGRVTLTAPSAVGDVVQRVGVLATLAGGGGSPQILVQVGDPVLLQ
jgi:hypothetical protein